LNQTSAWTRETFTIIQISGATLNGVVGGVRTGSTSSSFFTSLSNVPDGSFLATLGIRQNNNGQLQSVIGPSDTSASGQFNDEWYYSSANDIAGGDFNSGFALTISNLSTNPALAALALAPVPEPGTVGLLAVAGWWLLNQRRRRAVMQNAQATPSNETTVGSGTTTYPRS